MRKWFFLILLVSVIQSSLAQVHKLNGSRIYKLEGYIFPVKDTIKGYIAIPIRKGEVNYGSLANKVTFIDSLGNATTIYPGDIAAFGFKGEDVSGDYLSFKRPGFQGGKVFVKKLAGGDAVLVVDIVVKVYGGHGYASGPAGFNTASSTSTTQTFYYLKIGNGSFENLPGNENRPFSKNDLKKYLVDLPESFADSKDEIDISEVINIVSNYKIITPGNTGK